MPVVRGGRLETETDLWVGERQDLLRCSGPAQWQVAERTILLDQNVIASKNLSIFPETQWRDHGHSRRPLLTVVKPGEGEQTGPPAFRVTFKFWSSDTGGAFSLVEHPFPPGAIAPPHMHREEDEYSIVLTGEMGFRSGDREVVLGAGGYISKPRGEMHSMWNAGRTPARIIELIAPGGFERYFHEVADLVTDGSLDPGAAAGLAGKYGVTFGRPDWLDDVVERYGLTPPTSH